MATVLPNTFDPAESFRDRYLRSPEASRKEYLHLVQRNLWTFQLNEKKSQKILETVRKVVIVFQILLSLGFPLSLSYLPAWVSWGIGLPMIAIILPLIQSKLSHGFSIPVPYFKHTGGLSYYWKQLTSGSEYYKRQGDALLLLRQALRERAIKSLSPIGEWDLPAVDPHLKSDLMMKDELNKTHPRSAHDFARITSTVSSATRPCYDLEVTPFVQIQATMQLAQLPHGDGWDTVAETVGKAKVELVQGHVERYLQLIDEAKERAFAIGHGAVSREELDQFIFRVGYLNMSPKDFFETITQRSAEESVGLSREDLTAILKIMTPKEFADEMKGVRRLVRKLHGALETLHDQGYKLYQISHAGWAPYIDRYNAAVGAREDSFESYSHLYDLVQESHRLKSTLKEWIASHPTSILKKIEKDLQDAEAQLLIPGLIEILSQKNGNSRLDEVVLNKQRNREVLNRWIEKHPHFKADTVTQIVEMHRQIRSEIEKGCQKLREIQSSALQERVPAWVQYRKENFSGLDAYQARYHEGMLAKMRQDLFDQTMKNLEANAKRLLCELEQLHLEGGSLFKESHTAWADYIDMYRSVFEVPDQANAHLIDEIAEEESYHDQGPDDTQKILRMQGLIVHSHALKNELKKWIASHPTSMFADYEKHLKKSENTLLSSGLISELRLMDGDEVMGDFEMRDPVHRQELKAWLKKHYDLTTETVAKIVQRYDAMNAVIQSGHVRLDEIKALPFEDQAAALVDYRKAHVEKINSSLSYVGETSFWKRVGSALFSRVNPPFLPFETIELRDEDSVHLRSKKINEIRINQQLMKIDQQMLWINRIRRFGLEYVTKIALMIVAMLIANPWVIFGLSFASLAIHLISMKIDSHLEKMNREKQALKLEKELYPRTKIERIPGNCLEIEEVERVTDKYDLAAFHSTWGRSLVTLKPIELRA